MPRLRRSVFERLWSQVNQTGECWLWTGKQRRGYGRLKLRGHTMDPRHLTYTLAISEIPNGQPVSNTCRNPLCCRPEHLKLGQNPRRPKPDPENRRFWSKVEKTDGCWFWRAPISPKGYGKFQFGGKMQGAHRAGYRITKGEIPEGSYVRQLCKVRNCVRPDHLILTKAVGPFGLKYKIPTSEEVAEIRQALKMLSGRKYSRTARKFGVSFSCVRRIDCGQYRIGREQN